MKEIKQEELKTTENQRGLKDSLTKRRNQDNAGLKYFYPEPYKNKQNIYILIMVRKSRLILKLN